MTPPPTRGRWGIAAAVGDFGSGALLTAPVPRALMDPNDVPQTFLPLGIAYLAAALLGASPLRNPPPDYGVSGHRPSAAAAASTDVVFLTAVALPAVTRPPQPRRAEAAAVTAGSR